MFSSFRFDLLTFGAVVASSVILGFVIYFKDKKNTTNLLFLIFTIVSSLWSIFNYLAYQIQNPLVIIWIIRIVMFLAVYQALTFYFLVSVFPNSQLTLSKKWKTFLLPAIFLVSLLTLTPLVFPSVKVVIGQPPQPVPGPGILLFAFTAVSLVISGIVTLVMRTRQAQNKERSQLKSLSLGVVMMFVFILVFNFFFVTVLNNSFFIPYSALFVFPFVFFTYYAIAKHGLLDIKIVGTELLTLIIIITTFIEILLSDNLGEILFRSVIFIVLLIFGVLLIKSVLNEVEQRKKLEELTQKLRDLDQQKNEFISMAAHELRAPMTAIKGYISMILEGDTGDIPEKARGFLADATSINDRMVRLVNNMLNVSRIEEGRMSFQFDNDELSRVIRTVYSQFLPEAQRKNLEYKLDIPNNIKDKVYADVDKLHEIAGNLISNAIKYTEKGSVQVRLVQPDPQVIRFEVVDTGPGISPEEQVKLFQKFYRVESNVGKTTGTGLGLYISRLMIEKFKGKIGLNSEPGVGSTFWFELPIVSS